MSPSLAKRRTSRMWRLASVGLSMLPGVVGALLLMVMFVPSLLTAPGFAPVFPLMVIFYWGHSRAAEMPLWLAFALGLMMDVLGASVLGLQAMIYVLALAVLHHQYRHVHKEGFLIKWGYFALFLAGIELAYWALLSILSQNMLSLWPALLRWVITLGLYPLAHYSCGRLDRWIHRARWRVQQHL